jgi:eukaryotic-like serine/threonine-protein kinase
MMGWAEDKALLPDVGTTIASRFTIEGVAGRGGMGTVFQAKDLQTGELVALKLMRVDAPLNKQQSDSESAGSRRFLREAKVLADLRHPGIVSYIAHGLTPEGVPYLAMEWLDGEDLSRRMARCGLTLSESLALIKAATEALCLAHRRGIIHRDLKPSNLFLCNGRIDRVKVLDFGVAFRSASERTHVLTRTGTVVGTLDYMAPEQARGTRAISAAADVFSLGCVFFECLTKRPPFAADHPAALLAKILFEEAPRVRTLRPEMSERVDEVLARMLDKDPTKRIRDAEALLVALDSLGDLPELAAPARPTTVQRAALVDNEQCLVSVIIASDSLASPDRTTVGLSRVSMADDRFASMISKMSSFGAETAWLADRYLVATLSQTNRSTATDLAAQAARCAMYVKERWPEAKVALATGRGIVNSHVPVGEALDRAAHLLRTGVEMLGSATGINETVWMDDVTAGLLGAGFVERRLGPGVHALVGEQLDADSSRLLLGKPTPCVGREHELNLLDSALVYVTDESAARALLIIAEPGIGKSRLRHEFLRRLSARNTGVEVLFGRGDPMSAGSSFGILGRALQRLCGVSDGDPPEVRQQRLTTRIAKNLPPTDALRVVAFIGEICSTPFPGDDNVQLRAARNDPKLMSDQISRAFVDFLRAECAAHTVLIVLEDLHWGDASMVKLVESALRELAEAPLLVLALARPEVKDMFPHLWAGKAQEVPLSRLSRKACERLAREVLSDQVSSTTVQRLVAQSSGNALFLEELLRAAAEGKGDDLPETVLAMLQARISRLEPGARRVLRAASVFGETFWSGGVSALLGEEGDSAMLSSWLRHLSESEIIQAQPESRFPNESELAFRHALFRDAAYSLLTDQDRKRAHRLAGKYLLTVGERDPLVLGEHFQRGGDDASAIPHFIRAAVQALDGNDLEAAYKRAERAAACGAEGEQLGTLRSVQAWTLFWRADLQAAFPVGLEAVGLLPAGTHYWGRAMGNVFMAGGLIGKLGTLGDLIQTFAGTEPHADARTAFIEAASILATVFSLTGRREKAYQFLRRMDEIGLLVTSQDATARGWLRHAHNWHIRFLEPEPWRAFELATEATQAFEMAGDRRMAAVERVYLGIGQWDLGELKQGEATLRAALATGEQLHEVLVPRLARIYLALLLMEQRDPAAWDQVHELATVVAKDVPNTYYAGMAHCALAEELCARGQLDAAEGEAQKALATLKVAPPLQPLAYAGLGRVLIEQGRAEDARRLTDEGMALVASLGGAGRKEMKLRLRAVEARHAAGDVLGTRSALLDARRALDARAETIPDPAVRERFLTQVPDNARLVELCRTLMP